MLRVNIKPCMSKVIPMVTDNHEYAFFGDPLDHSLGNHQHAFFGDPLDHSLGNHSEDHPHAPMNQRK